MRTGSVDRKEWLRIRGADGVSAGFDYLAEKFWRETGKFAPGKDVPAAMGGGDWTANFDEFHQWRKQYGLYPTHYTEGVG